MAPVKPGPRLGWTARPADARGWNFSEYGWQVYSFKADRGDSGRTSRGYSQNVPLTWINSLTDTITLHHNTNWEPIGTDNRSGVYDDGRQPSDFFAVSPAMSRADGFGGEDATGFYKDADDCFPGLLKGGFVGTRSSDGTATFTFKQLVPGHEYLAEIYVHHDSGSNSVTAPDGVTVAYYGGTVETENDWKYGGFLTGRFTATGTTKEFVFTFSNRYQINAVQLRDLTEPPAINGEKWSAFQNAADPADTIITDGKLKYAYARGGYTVNGVAFAANSMLKNATDDISVSPEFINDKGDYGSVSGIDSGYANILANGWIATSGYKYDFTFKKLTPGGRYTAQFIIHNSNNTPSLPRIVTGSGNAPFVRYGSDSSEATAPWYYGGNLVVEFVAESTEHTTSLEFLGSAKGFICVNAVQLREAVLPIAEQAAALKPTDGWLALPMQGAATDFATNGTCIAATGASNGFSSGGEFAHGGDASVAGIPFRGSKAYYTGAIDLREALEVAKG